MYTPVACRAAASWIATADRTPPWWRYSVWRQAPSRAADRGGDEWPWTPDVRSTIIASMQCPCGSGRAFVACHGSLDDAPAKVPVDRSVRVFVSSTFRDMHAERDHLVSVVFPELRERVAALGFEFSEVDLRWGVPERDADGERANSWEYCKKWIERAQPFFVGILGERYGYVPDPARDPRSITELEIKHGALSQELRRNAFFYFRKTTVPLDAAADARATYVDGALPLAKLKDEIRSAGLPVRDYSCRWDGKGFRDLDAFGRMLLEDLWSAILRDPRYLDPGAWERLVGRPMQDDPDLSDAKRPIHRDLWEPLLLALEPPLVSATDRETSCMTRYAQAAVRWFQERTEELEELTRFVCQPIPAGSSPLFVLRGESGAGKTAVLAVLAERLASAGLRVLGYPAKARGALVIPHYVGASPRSTSTRWLMERTLIERGQASATEVSALEWKELRARFAQALEGAGNDLWLVLLIDGLDRLDTGEALHWLPRNLSQRVRIVVTTDTAVLQDRQPPARLAQLPRLRSAGVARVIEAYLDEHCKLLDRDALAALSSFEAAGNPLYLRCLLQIIRTLGGDDLNVAVPRILSGLAAERPSLHHLFDWQLERLEVFGAEEVRRFCSYLLLARGGLRGGDLSALLARRFGERAGQTAKRIERGLSEFLLRDDGTVRFGPHALRLAAEQRYLNAAGSGKERLHSEIADHFRDLARGTGAALDPDTLLEGGYHFLTARRWADAAAHFLDKGHLTSALRGAGWSRVLEDLSATLLACRRAGAPPPLLLEEIVLSLRRVRAALEGTETAWESAADALWNDLERAKESNRTLAAGLDVLGSSHLEGRLAPARPRLAVRWFNGRGNRPDVGDRVSRVFVDRQQGLAVTLGTEITVWRIADRSLVSKMRSAANSDVGCFLPPGGLLATAAGESVEIWNISTGERLDSFVTGSPVQFLAAHGADIVVATAKGCEVHRGPLFERTWNAEWEGSRPAYARYVEKIRTLFVPGASDSLVSVQPAARTPPEVEQNEHTLHALASSATSLVVGDDEGALSVRRLDAPHAEVRRGRVTSAATPARFIEHGINTDLLVRGRAITIDPSCKTPPTLTKTNPAWISALEVSDDERLLAVGGYDGVFKILSFEKLELLQEVNLGLGPISSIACVGAGVFWVTAGWRAALEVSFHAAAGRLVVEPITGRVEYHARLNDLMLVQSRFGRQPISVVQPSGEQKWEDGVALPESPSPLGPLPRDFVPRFSPSGRLVAVGERIRPTAVQRMTAGSLGGVAVFKVSDLSAGKSTVLQYQAESLLDGNWTLACVSDHGTVAVASVDVVILRAGKHQLRITEPFGRAPQKEGELGALRAASVALFLSSSDVLAIGGHRALKVLDASGNEVRELASFELPSEPTALINHPRGGVLGFCASGEAFSYRDGSWQVHSTKLQHVSAVALAPDGQRLVAASRKHRRIHLLDAELGEHFVEAYPYPIEDIRWCPGGRILVADGFGNLAGYQAL